MIIGLTNNKINLYYLFPHIFLYYLILFFNISLKLRLYLSASRKHALAFESLAIVPTTCEEKTCACVSRQFKVHHEDRATTWQTFLRLEF